MRTARVYHTYMPMVNLLAGLATALVPRIGYDAAAAIALAAASSGRTVREVALAGSGLSEAELDALLDPLKITAPEPT